MDMSWEGIDTYEWRPKNYSSFFVKLNYFEAIRLLKKILLSSIGVPGKEYLSLWNLFTYTLVIPCCIIYVSVSSDQ